MDILLLHFQWQLTATDQATTLGLLLEGIDQEVEVIQGAEVEANQGADLHIIHHALTDQGQEIDD